MGFQKKRERQFYEILMKKTQKFTKYVFTIAAELAKIVG